MKQPYKQRATHRSKIIAGQLAGLQKMIENDAYCMDILTQSLAIQRSLASLNKLVLENHIHTHVTDMLQTGDEALRTKAIEELKQLYELHNIRSN